MRPSRSRLKAPGPKAMTCSTRRSSACLRPDRPTNEILNQGREPRPIPRRLDREPMQLSSIVAQDRHARIQTAILGTGHVNTGEILRGAARIAQLDDAYPNEQARHQQSCDWAAGRLCRSCCSLGSGLGPMWMCDTARIFSRSYSSLIRLTLAIASDSSWPEAPHLHGSTYRVPARLQAISERTAAFTHAKTIEYDNSHRAAYR